MPRSNPSDRLRRLLALVPWVAAQEGPTVEEVCARFDTTEAELAADLEMLYMCGLHPFTPDMLMEADIEDGRVWIHFAEYFSRPLKLSGAEGLAVLAAGKALLAVPGSDQNGALSSALEKLAAAMGIDDSDAVEIELGDVVPNNLETIKQAIESRHAIDLDYYSYGRDEMTTRRVNPERVFSSAGQWYLRAFDLSRADERLFRLDRIRDVSATKETFEPRTTTTTSSDRIYSPRPDDPEIVLDLDRSAQWVAEQYPHELVEELEDGRVRVVLKVSEQAWLDRLLLRLGTSASARSADGLATDLRSQAAARILTKYS